MYWIWQSLRANDDEARIADRPAVISELGVRFDEGARIEVAVPMIRMVRDEDSQGQLTDNLIAPGTTGLVLSSRLRQLLTAHGVHNIEYYPVALENPVDNTRSDDYQLGNLIGRVACSISSSRNCSGIRAPGLSSSSTRSRSTKARLANAACFERRSTRR